MYQPAHHREDRLEAQHALIRDYPLGLLVSNGPEGIVANAMPFLLQADEGSSGRLETHMARANDQWRAVDGQPVLVVFQGPDAYISPSHYVSKRDTGKVVPTWNYAMVQVRGIARLRSDADWLARQIAALTARHEADRAPAWKVSDAPAAFIESQLRGIVGIEIAIAAIAGKWKVSQNRPEADRRGVAEGLSQDAPAMADLVRRYGGL